MSIKPIFNYKLSLFSKKIQNKIIQLTKEIENLSYDIDAIINNPNWIPIDNY